MAKPRTVSDEVDRTNIVSASWMYEAKSGGWWLYERRLSDEIEEAFNSNKDKLKVQISGFLYVVDFENMVQYRIEKPDRRRRIKRITTTEEDYKGIAGIPVGTCHRRENTSSTS